MPKLKIITFGCQANEHDSERIAGLLLQRGYELTDREEEADLILLNTCSIRRKAEEKLYSRLGHLAVLKRRKPSLRIGVCGCVAEQEGDGIRRRFPCVDLVVGIGQIALIPYLLGEKKEGEDKPGLLTPHRFHPVKAWVEIMRGCDNFCTYCVVPHLRGREESRQPEEILKEIDNLREKGYREITLLGHNVDSYGKGLHPPISFPELLRRIEERVAGSMWVRFATSHPKDISPDLARCLAELSSLCEHIHLPVQSGSDRILHLMNRGYDRQRYLEIVDLLRSQVPHISITTDVMVGFPGETERDFNDTLELVERVKFDRIFSFKYSPRPRTAAMSLPDQIPETVKIDRFHRLISLQNRISEHRNQALVGKVVEVLVEEEGSKKDPEVHTARTRTNHVVHFRHPKVQVGSRVLTKIVAASAFHLKGEVISFEALDGSRLECICPKRS